MAGCYKPHAGMPSFTTPPTPGGILYEKLPMELIDEIYSYALPAEYNMRWDPKTANCTVRRDRETGEYSRDPEISRECSLTEVPAILRTSWTIRADAQLMIPSKTTFKYSVMTDGYKVDYWSPLRKVKIHLCKNVEFTIWQGEYGYATRDGDPDHEARVRKWVFEFWCEKSIDRFRGSDVRRGTCRVRVVLLPHEPATFLTTAIIDAVKHLQDFAKLVFEVYARTTTLKFLPSYTVDHWEWLENMDNMASKLEASLGPSIKSNWHRPALEDIADEKVLDDAKDVRRLEFRPLEHARKMLGVETSP